ncbi:Fet3 ferroxidase protein [Hymenopellis radicata]|nr:Fet3 ferroxidase protein [Hymenopellis radicata]
MPFALRGTPAVVVDDLLREPEEHRDDDSCLKRFAEHDEENGHREYVLRHWNVLAGVHEVWWNITYVEDVNPDGLFDRRVIDPPPIEVSTNDSLRVHATNSLDALTTLHHHGMFFNSTSWMDGADGVSEMVLSFTYEVPIDTSGQWGTYWVHAHASGQYVDGLRAPLYDAEFTVALGDWYHDEHPVLLKKFVNIANPGGAEPVPEREYLEPISGRSSSATYRLRIVNTSAFAMFFFWIDGHDMRITDVEESPSDLLSLAVAQRYSILVTARNDTNANWAIHANMDTDMFDTVPDALNPNTTSSITYSSSAQVTDLGLIDEYATVNDTELVPVIVMSPPVVTKTIELEVSFDTMDDGTNHAMFNQITYNSPLVPAVFSELSLGNNATVEAAYGPNSFVVDHMDVVDIVIKNGDAGKHPFHLHGHKPWLVGRATDYTSDDPTLNPPIVEGQRNPVRRDTVHIPSMGSATLRVVADNPGVWFLHCHIEWHLEVGLAIQLVEAPLVAQALGKRPPQEMFDNCQALGLPTVGNAAGHASATDLDGLKVGPFPQNLGWHPRGVGALVGCILSALVGMCTVAWYSMGGYSEEEIEREVRERISEKAKRGRFFGLMKTRVGS